MKFVKLCMIVGLVASGTLYGDAEIEKKNKETENLLKEMHKLEKEDESITQLMDNNESNHEELANEKRSIRARLKEIRLALGLPHNEPGKNWTKIILASTAIVTLTAATGGLAGGGLALLLKGTACTAAQLGGAAGGIVGAHGVGNSLYKTGDVDFDKVAKATVPRAAMAGGVVGGTYAIATGVVNGFDGGIGGAVASYIKNKSDKTNVTSQKVITKNTPDTIAPDFVNPVKSNFDRACEAA